MMIYEVRYYLSPVLILLLGVSFVVLGILAIVFRVRVKAFFNATQRMTFGDRIGDRMDAAPIRWLVVAFCGLIAFGLLFVVFGIVGIATNAHVYPQPH